MQMDLLFVFVVAIIIESHVVVPISKMSNNEIKRCLRQQLVYNKIFA